jgi:hypothetical protein
MFTEFHRKVRAEHLRRDAFLYVRHNAAKKVMAERLMVMQ